MNENFPKYILAFLGAIYLLSCVAEVMMTKTGVNLVFESIRTLVPHMTMFILGYYFSRK